MAVFGCGAHFHAEEGAPGQFVEPEEVAKWVDEATCIMVDVREEMEMRERGPIPGAMQLSAGSIMFSKPDLLKKVDILKRSSKPIVCYTDFGVEKSRCGSVCEWFVDQGLPAERLYRLKGGRNTWVAEKYPTCQMGDLQWKLASDAQLADTQLTDAPKADAQPIEGERRRDLRWKVVGGGDKGGIVVRDGHALSSPQKESRLATGALVTQVQLAGERLCYKLLEGEGPASGWVSIRLTEKALCTLHEEGAPQDLAGLKVRVDGLQSETGKLLNGKEGMVQSYAAEKERYVVKFYGSGEEKAFKIGNLTPVMP